MASAGVARTAVNGISKTRGIDLPRLPMATAAAAFVHHRRRQTVEEDDLAGQNIVIKVVYSVCGGNQKSGIRSQQVNAPSSSHF